jgi:hypothetical protein
VNLRRLLPSRARAAPPTRLFVSYRRGDAAAYAGRLYDALAARFGAANVFMDVDAIGLGSDYRETIDGALESCDAAIALIGRGWLPAVDEDGTRRLDDPGDVLRMELEQALTHDLVVIPALVGGATLPEEEELPASLVPLVRRQGIELRDSTWRDDVARLMRRLEAIHAPPEAERATNRRTRWAVLGALALALVVAAAVAALVLRDGDDDGEGGSGARSSEPAAVRQLLAAVPLPLRTDCEPVDYGPEAALAHLSCGTGNAAVSYHLFEPDVLSGWYTLARENAGITEGTGSCEDVQFPGEDAYMVQGSGVGRWFCFMDGDEPNLVWTDERESIGAEANIWKGTGLPAAESLVTQWECCFRAQR